MVYVITRNEMLVDKVKTGLKTSAVSRAANAAEFLLLPPPDPSSRPACVIIDLSSATDAEQVIQFTASSPKVGHLPILVAGTAEELALLPVQLLTGINGVITTPCSSAEIAEVISDLGESPS